MDGDHVIQVGKVDFRNDNRMFGIKHEDRFLHVYVIGKTGTGKSTLIETMALQDLERGNGFALIDPHGDLVARVAVPGVAAGFFFLANDGRGSLPGTGPCSRRHCARSVSREDDSHSRMVLSPTPLATAAILNLIHKTLNAEDRAV
jgi:hypothetical protein